MQPPAQYRDPGRPVDTGPPPYLRDAPEDRRIDATRGFGWSLLVWMGGITAVGMPFGVGSIRGHIAILGPAVVLVTVLAVALHVALKRNLPSFVLYDDRVAVYEKGKFDLVVPPTHIQPYHLQGLNTYRMMTGYFILAFCGLCGSFTAVVGDMAGPGLMSIALLFGSVAGVINAYVTRDKCRNYNIMTRSGVQRFLFRTNQLHSVSLSVKWFFVG